MIAVGGSIGTGLFIGSGGALSVGGPAAIIIDWLIIGFMVLMTCQAIGEMAILYPLSGGFYALAVRMLDPAWGFAYVHHSWRILNLLITSTAWDGTMFFNGPSYSPSKSPQQASPFHTGLITYPSAHG